jgi:hypothetical protein
MKHIAKGINRRIIMGIFLLSPVLLASCQTPEPPVLVVTPLGNNLPLQVASIDFFNDHDPQAVKPYIDHLYYPGLSDMLVNWGSETLIPADASGNLLMTVSRADLRELDIASNDDLKSLFTNEHRKLIVADLEAVFSFTHPVNNRTASIVVKASYQNTIADYTTPADSERIRQFVMSEAIARFDAEFRKQVLDISSGNGWPVAR